jgi:hypothetical protein
MGLYSLVREIFPNHGNYPMWDLIAQSWVYPSSWELPNVGLDCPIMGVSLIMGLYPHMESSLLGKDCLISGKDCLISGKDFRRMMPVSGKIA